MAVGRLERVIAAVFRRINRWRVWYRLPFPLAVANLVTLRADLRQRNLYDTETAAEGSCRSVRFRHPPLPLGRWKLQ